VRRPFIPLFVMLALLPGRTFAGARAVTPFDLLPPGDIVIPVTIDGQGPFRMLFDTGSSRSAVTSSVARRLGSRLVGRTIMVTPAGRATRALVLLKRLRIGDGDSASVAGLQLDEGDLAPGIDGLIGQDLLAARVYTIDYAAGRIVWHGGVTPVTGGTRLDLELTGGRMLVTLPQRAKETAAAGSVLRLIPDSGADRLLLFTHADLPALVLLDVGLLKGAAGARVVQQVRVAGLAVGTITLLDQDAALVESTADDAPLGDGLLPLHLFARVTINGPGRYLVVER
jgi:Aspartyl protease